MTGDDGDTDDDDCGTGDVVRDVSPLEGAASATILLSFLRACFSCSCSVNQTRALILASALHCSSWLVEKIRLFVGADGVQTPQQNQTQLAESSTGKKKQQATANHTYSPKKMNSCSSSSRSYLEVAKIKKRAVNRLSSLLVSNRL
mmetsp:Transcript_5795/g.16242  ORF Transcript_5795/g.16242 Transcript_5795/m.16242 type:complete len:146 (-) Transcript_5795:122-559(-)